MKSEGKIEGGLTLGLRKLEELYDGKECWAPINPADYRKNARGTWDDCVALAKNILAIDEALQRPRGNTKMNGVELG